MRCGDKRKKGMERKEGKGAVVLLSKMKIHRPSFLTIKSDLGERRKRERREI
jgi:hypothetical protein